MSNTYIEIIGVKILCKCFINNLYQYAPFSKLASNLNNKHTIACSRNFLLKLIGNIDNVNSKIFLSCFMIKHHPNVLLTNNTVLEQNIKQYSDKLLKYIHDIYESKNKFSYNFYISRFKKYYIKIMLLIIPWQKIK